MLGFSWLAALILLCLLAVVGWLIRRGLRRALAPRRGSRSSERGRPSTELDGTQSTATGSSDWATQVLDEARATRPPDRGPGAT
ncbi:MAG: hypothetical protein QOK10_1099 [Pseudonocardiales bacterium]|nr:hypothetical protein [Pseudonocardiales bacterium]